jgi:hypothetical protein
MALDIRQYEPSRVWQNLEEPLVVIDTLEQIKDTLPENAVHSTDSYQFRYVVHRQHVGFYTPVVFDVSFSYWAPFDKPVSTKVALNKIAEPFVEGALFMNHESQFIVDMLKGQEAGFNRKDLKDDIVRSIRSINGLWYSDWGVPPVTRQSQRVVIYDMDATGSMLDPVNVLTNFPAWVANALGKAEFPYIYGAEIVAGYTEKTV